MGMRVSDLIICAAAALGLIVYAAGRPGAIVTHIVVAVIFANGACVGDLIGARFGVDAGMFGMFGMFGVGTVAWTVAFAVMGNQIDLSALLASTAIIVVALWRFGDERQI